MSTITVTTEIDVFDIVEAIAALHNEGVMEVIKNIDEMLCDWEFTLAAYEYFAKLKKVYDDENIGE